MSPRITQFNLTFLFVLTFVVAIALAIARVSMSLPLPLLAGALPVLLFILAVLRFTLREYEPLGARIRASLAGAGFVVWVVDTLVRRATAPRLVSLGSDVVLALLAAIWVALIVWQAFDFPGGWRFGAACPNDAPGGTDDVGARGPI